MQQDLRGTPLSSKKAASVPTNIGTVRCKRIVLDPALSVTEVFVAVTRGCIGHIATAVDTTRRSDDPEGTHQLLVGIHAAFWFLLG